MKRLLVVASALSLAVPFAAHAYLISGAAVLKKMASVREELQLGSLVVRGEMTLHGEEAAALSKALHLDARENLSVPAVVSYRMPGRCRVELVAPGLSEPVAATNAHGTVTAVGPKLPSLKVFAAQACGLLDPRGGAEGVVAWAREQGVDVSKVNLGRVDGVIAFVVGARAKDSAIPSLWVEKERFGPVKLVTKDGSSWREVRLVDYSSAAAGQWHPRIVEIRRDGKVEARFVAEKAEPNAKVPESW